MFSHWIREQTAEVWLWWRLWYLSSQTNTDTCGAGDACNSVHVTICPSLPLRKFYNAGLTICPMCCTTLHHYMLFFFYLTTTVSLHTALSRQALYQLIVPLYFEILYLPWERPFINIPTYLCLYCSLGSYLLSALLLMGYHNTQEVSFLPGLPTTGQLLWRKPESQQIFVLLQRETALLFFSKPS